MLMLTGRCKADVLRAVIDATSPLVDEAKFKIGPDGIGLRAVDPAHVAMVDLTLKKTAFISYKADEMEIGIDMDKFKEVLKLASSDDEVDLEYDVENHRLIVRVGNIVRRMSLVDTTAMADPKIPNLDLPAHITIATSELERGIRASEAVSDHVALIAEKDFFELVAEGDTDTVNLKLVKEMLPALKVEGRAKSLFSLDYFTNMVKAAKGSDAIHLNLGNDYPVRMEFDFASGNGHVTYLLAPRIES